MKKDAIVQGETTGKLAKPVKKKEKLFAKTLTSLVVDDRVGQRVAFKGKKGVVNAVSANNKQNYMDKFDAESSSGKRKDFQPNDLKLLDSEGNKIVLSEDAFKNEQARIKSRPRSKLENTLSSVTQAERVGTRIAYKGCKRTVSAAEAGKSFSEMTIDDPESSSKQKLFASSDLRILGVDDEEITMSEA